MNFTLKQFGKEGLGMSILELLPSIASAADTALVIQQRMKEGVASTVEQKASENPFEAACTDADHYVQTSVGGRLVQYGNVHFRGEEGSHDHVTPYFTRLDQAQYLILLDPIDGTRYFMDGLHHFDIILTVLEGGKIVAAVVYQPHENRALIAVESKLYRMNRLRIDKGQLWTSMETLPPLGSRDSRIVVTDPETPNKLLERMEMYGLKPIRYTDYVTGKRWGAVQRRIFEGAVAGFVRSGTKRSPVQCQDVGALGYLVQAAKGGYCRFHPIDERDHSQGYSLLVAMHPQIVAEAWWPELEKALFR